MGVEKENSAVYGHKLSTVVPGSATGDGIIHELTTTDLIVKLHYLRAVYYLKQSEIIDGLAISDLKEPMFSWLNVCYPVAGRIRRAEGGRPLIKCNDCGLRIVEAKCSRTLEEWLEVEDSLRWRLLVPEKILCQELHFSPLVYMQFTQFKCGGMAIGYSWAHVLGDAVSATNCIKMWGELLKGNPPRKGLQLNHSAHREESPTNYQVKATQKPALVKQVEVTGDCWLTPSTYKMATYSFKIADTELKKIFPAQQHEVPPFEMISALFWQCLANIRSSRESKVATICRFSSQAKSNQLLSNNNFKTSTVALGSSAGHADPSELATLISKQAVDELKSVENLVGVSGKPDFVLYGANLTFVDMEGIDLYGLEIKGQKPVQVDYSIDGVGDEGVVLVLEGPQQADESGNIKERNVRVILPEDEITQLREVLSSKFGLA